MIMPLVAAAGNTTPGAYNNYPIANVPGTIGNAINWVVGIFVVLAFLFLIVSAFHWISAAGDPAKIATARGYLIYALVGVAVAALAWGLMTFIVNTIIQ